MGFYSIDNKRGNDITYKAEFTPQLLIIHEFMNFLNTLKGAGFNSRTLIEQLTTGAIIYVARHAPLGGLHKLCAH